MLYQYLLDDVARKQPKKTARQSKQTEYVESSTGELIPSKTATGLFRARSTPKRKEAFHYPLNAVERDSEGDDSVPTSPQVPAFAATRMAKEDVHQGSMRLTI